MCQKNPCFGRVVEGLFSSKAGPKRGCSSYLIAIMRKQTSEMCELALIFVRYDKNPLFGPAFIKIKHTTTQPKQGGFLHKNQFTFFSSIKCEMRVCRIF